MEGKGKLRIYVYFVENHCHIILFSQETANTLIALKKRMLKNESH